MKNNVLRILLTFSTIALFAQTPRSMTVEQAVEQAVSTNLGMQIEARKLSILERQKNFVWNMFIPSVTAGTALSRLNQDQVFSTLVPLPSPPYVTQKTIDIDEWSLGLSLNFQLALTPALFRGITQTVIDFENGSLTRDTALRKLERDVRKAFYQILALQEAVNLTRSQLENSFQRYQQSEANFRAGRSPELTVLQAQVSWENRKPALREQEQALENSLMNFQFLIGIPFDEKIQLNGNIEPYAVEQPNLEDGLIDRVSKRLDVQAALGGVKSLETVLQLQYDSMLPTLLLMFSMDPGIAEPFKAESWETDNWKQRSGMFALNLSMKLDGWIPGSTTWVSNENLKDQLEQAKIGLAQAIRGGEMEVTSLLRRLLKSQESLRALELNVELSQRASRLSETSYRAGGQSLLEVQEADLQLQTARLQLLNEKLSFNNTVLDLEYALNTPREEW